MPRKAQVLDVVIQPVADTLDERLRPARKLRALAVVILIAAAGGVALLTTKGKATVAFAREARTEVRKVIWPTRQETLHTTLIVAAVTAVMSLILWGLDGILVRLVSFITGLRF